MGRVVLEIIIPTKEVLGRIVSQQEVREENHRSCVTALYTLKVHEEAFSVIVKVEEHKGMSGVKERVVAEHRRTRSLKEAKPQKDTKEMTQNQSKEQRG